jgi:hypothetical protein
MTAKAIPPGYGLCLYGFFFAVSRFFAAVSAVARCVVSAAVIVGETEPDALAARGAPPASPGVAPAPIVSKPFRGPFEHAPASATPPIAANRTSLCTVRLLLRSVVENGKKHAHRGQACRVHEYSFNAVR